MKKYLLFVILIINSLVGAEEKDFMLLAKTMEKNYNEKKYNEALENLNDIKKIIEGSKEKTVVTTTNSDFDSLLKQVKSPVELKIGNEIIEIEFGGTTIYTTRNDVVKADILLDYENTYTFWIYYKNKLAIENKYVKINDQAKIVKFSSSDEKTLTINTSGKFIVKKAGNVIVTISLDENKVVIPIKIVRVPIGYEMSTDKLIETLGLPDRVNEDYVSYFDSEWIDGIFYSSSKGDSIHVEHWFYDKYPDMIVTPFNKKVYTPSWERRKYR